MLRRLLWIVALIFAVGCGDGTGPDNTGTLDFVLDGVTCDGWSGVSIEMFVDGVSRGTRSCSAGIPHGVAVDAGTHLASARIANSGSYFGQTT